MMKKKKIRFIVIISSIFALLIGIVMSFLIYMRGNEYSKIAWNALSKEQRKNVIGGGSLSHVETIKPKNSYIVPNDPISKMQNRYEAQDELCIFFKDWVPDFIARIKIALMDGRIIAKHNNSHIKCYLVQIKGISAQKLRKLVHKSYENSLIISAANYDIEPIKTYYINEYFSQDIKNIETPIVTFYYFKGIKLYCYIVYVVKDSEKISVIDTQKIGIYESW